MKADKTEVEQRINELTKMLLNGCNREDILLHCSDNWGIGERQSDNYILRAKDKIELSARQKIEYNYGKSERRFEDLYKKCYDKGDYKTAAMINKELSTLQGLYKLQVEIEHSGEVNFICNIPLM